MDNGQSSVFSRDSPHERILKLEAPMFLGVLVNYFLWGVQITQSYHYYKSYRKTDRTWLKFAVASLFIMDMLESVCFAQACWIFLVNGWGDIAKVLTFPGWGFYATPLMDAGIASIVHFFYAHKVWILLETPYNYIGAGSVVLLSSIQLVAAIGGTIFLYVSHMTILEFTRFKTWACVWLITAAVTDIVIASLLARKLSRSRTGIKYTDDVISKLIRLTVETGLATATVQLADIIAYLFWTQESFHVFFACVAPKVYSNSMLALLNSRSTSNQTTVTWAAETRPCDSIHFRTPENQFTVADHDDQRFSTPLPPPHAKLRSYTDGQTSYAKSYNSFPFIVRKK